MNEAIKQKWIEALRSDKYKQGKKALHAQTGEFCCLGVLCDLYVQEKGAKWEVHVPDYTIVDAENNRPTPCFILDGKTGVLPITVRDWALINTCPQIKTGSEEDQLWESLTHLNDLKELTFKEIADLIETCEII